MPLTQYVILCLLAAACAAALAGMVRSVGAARRQRLLWQDAAGCCESVGFVGISAVCTGVSDMEHIASLLGAEYGRYELVVVLDAQLSPDEFRGIAEHYGMIRVDCAMSDELPSARVRALYRSRRRNYRRLILVDRRRQSPYDDLDAGAAVATYDYIMPLGPDTRLASDAVEMAAAAIASDGRDRVAMLWSAAGAGCRIFHRDTVVGAGGFSPRMLRHIPRRAVLRLRVPLTYDVCSGRRMRIAAWCATLALILPLCTVAALLFGACMAAAVAASAALWIAAVCYAEAATSPAPCSVRAILCRIGRMSRLFGPEKFTVS